MKRRDKGQATNGKWLLFCMVRWYDDALEPNLTINSNVGTRLPGYKYQKTDSYVTVKDAC